MCRSWTTALITSPLPKLNNTIPQCQLKTSALPSNSVQNYTVMQKSTLYFTPNFQCFPHLLILLYFIVSKTKADNPIFQETNTPVGITAQEFPGHGEKMVARDKKQDF
jgi:hypothetical protein